ncbi:hypothetical protein ACTHGU_07035 [Chitinophagaceae bacterium MMS25-I14]
MAGLRKKGVYDILLDKGVDELHHANSVASACLFIRSQSLLSRGTVERRGLKQTIQKSDTLDRRFSIWFDVFLDTVDIHYRAQRYNEYGPVTFVFDIELIRQNITGDIWVTKENPSYWAGSKNSARWFQDLDELDEGFVKGRFNQMIVFRHCGGELLFKNCLKKIILDNPNMRNDDNVYLYAMAYGALRSAMADTGLNIPIERRNCRSQCSCRDSYAAELERTNEMFDPLII